MKYAQGSTFSTIVDYGKSVWAYTDDSASFETIPDNTAEGTATGTIDRTDGTVKFGPFYKPTVVKITATSGELDVRNYEFSVTPQTDNEFNEMMTATNGMTPEEIGQAIQSAADSGGGYVTPEMFGAVSDGVTNDREALRAAISSQSGPVLISSDIYVSVTEESDVIRLLDNTEIVFLNGSAIKNDGFGFGIFLAVSKSNIRLVDPRIIYTGSDLPTTLPSGMDTYRDNVVSESGAVAFNERAMANNMFFIKCRNIDVIRPKFESENYTVNTRCLNRSIAFAECTDVNVPSMYLNGVHWGITAWGNSGFFTATDIKSRYFGQLDLTTYTWEDAAHPIYLTGQAANSQNVKCSIQDSGEAATGTYYSVASVSAKFMAVDDLVLDVYSRRDHGCFDIAATTFDVNAQWVPVGNGLVNQGMNRFLTDAGLSEVKNSRADILLNVPDGYTNICLELSSGGTSNDFENCEIKCQINYDGTGTGVPICILRGSNNDIDLTFNAPNLTGSQTLFRLDSGDYNSIKTKTRIPDSASVRHILNGSKSNYMGNEFACDYVYQGRKEVRSQSGGYITQHVSNEFVNVSGASVSASNLFPAGAKIESVCTITTSSIGTSNGTTGYQVGDGVDVDKWGVRSGTGFLGGTDNSDWTDGTIQSTTSSSDAVITATGGDFDGTGSIKFMAAYTTFDRSTDWY